MKTASFKDFKMVTVQPKRKNGRTKYEWVITEVIDGLLPVEVSLQSDRKTYYVRESKLNALNLEQRGNASMQLYNEDGSDATGMYRHGYTGSKIHTETLHIWWRTRELIKIDNYINGKVKDSKRYLLKLL